MTVKSVFEFKFPKDAQDHGLILCRGIGHDMINKPGYLDHEVIQDVKDPGHLTVSTHWKSQEDSDAVLSVYQHDEKIKKASELIGGSPAGFVGSVILETA